VLSQEMQQTFTMHTFLQLEQHIKSHNHCTHSPWSFCRRLDIISKATTIAIIYHEPCADGLARRKSASHDLCEEGLARCNSTEAV
jgi:hypothetical protein